METKLPVLLDSARTRRANLEKELQKTFTTLRSELETREASLKQRIAQVYTCYENMINEADSSTKGNISDKMLINGDPFKKYETWQRTVLPERIRTFINELERADKNEASILAGSDRTPSLTPTHELDMFSGMDISGPPVELLARQITDMTDSPTSPDIGRYDIDTDSISKGVSASTVSKTLSDLAGAAEMITDDLSGLTMGSGGSPSTDGAGVVPPPSFIERQQTDIDEYDPAIIAKAAGSVAFSDDLLKETEETAGSLAQDPLASDIVLPSLIQRQITDHEMSAEERHESKNESSKDLPRTSFGVDINDLASQSFSKLPLTDDE